MLFRDCGNRSPPKSQGLRYFSILQVGLRFLGTAVFGGLWFRENLAEGENFLTEMITKMFYKIMKRKTTLKPSLEVSFFRVFGTNRSPSKPQSQNRNPSKPQSLFRTAVPQNHSLRTAVPQNHHLKTIVPLQNRSPSI